MKAYTDLEQSKKLAEFLPLESADMYYYSVNGDLYRTPNVIESEDDLYVDEKSIPCWSLVALLELIPKQFGKYTKSLYWFHNAWHCEYIDEDSDTGRCLYTIGNDNLVDAAVKMILKLHELNLL